MDLIYQLINVAVCVKSVSFLSKVNKLAAIPAILPACKSCLPFIVRFYVVTLQHGLQFELKVSQNLRILGHGQKYANEQLILKDVEVS